MKRLYGAITTSNPIIMVKNLFFIFIRTPILATITFLGNLQKGEVLIECLLGSYKIEVMEAEDYEE